jgi:hypothetical protein
MRWCIHCLKFFIPGRRDRVYCSKACKQAAYRERSLGAVVRLVWDDKPGHNVTDTATTLQHGS